MINSRSVVVNAMLAMVVSSVSQQAPAQDAFEDLQRLVERSARRLTLHSVERRAPVLFSRKPNSCGQYAVCVVRGLTTQSDYDSVCRDIKDEENNGTTASELMEHLRKHGSASHHWNSNLEALTRAVDDGVAPIVSVFGIDEGHWATVTGYKLDIHGKVQSLEVMDSVWGKRAEGKAYLERADFEQKWARRDLISRTAPDRNYWLEFRPTPVAQVTKQQARENRQLSARTPIEVHLRNQITAFAQFHATTAKQLRDLEAMAHSAEARRAVETLRKRFDAETAVLEQVEITIRELEQRARKNAAIAETISKRMNVVLKRYQ